MDDIVKTMKAQLYDRVASPLIFTFLCSWAAANYRLVLIVFSGLPVSDKFMQIELIPLQSPPVEIAGYVVDPWWAYWTTHGLVYPLFLTLFYLLLLPKFEAVAFRWSQEKAAKLKAIRLHAEGSTPIGEEEAQVLRQAMRDAEKKLDSEMQEQRKLLNGDIQRLTYDIDSERGLLAAARQEVTRLTTELEVKTRQYEAGQIVAREAALRVRALLNLSPEAREVLHYFSPAQTFTLHNLVRDIGHDQAVGCVSDLIKAGLVIERGGEFELSELGLRTLLEPPAHE